VASKLPLTDSQVLLLEDLAAALTDKEIAGRRGISLAGAKKQVAYLRRHYGVTNRVGVVRAAIECGDLHIAGPRNPNPSAEFIGESSP
jgi:DNA-binding NarL/FixJ family response regulator